MSENKQPLDKHEKNVKSIPTGQPYASNTSTGAGKALDENAPTITGQIDAHPAGKGMNSGLARALVGGLIGATLGTLAGALANKRTLKGANYAVKGVGDGVKTVGEGINLTAKGVGNAVKSVAEGVNYAVVGGIVDAVKDTAEGAKQSVAGALDAVKDTAEGAKQSVGGAPFAATGATEDVKLSDNQRSKLDEERLVVVNKQATTGEVGIAEQGETQTALILVPVESEPVVELIIPVDAGTPDETAGT